MLADSVVFTGNSVKLLHKVFSWHLNCELTHMSHLCIYLYHSWLCSKLFYLAFQQISLLAYVCNRHVLSSKHDHMFPSKPIQETQDSLYQSMLVISNYKPSRFAGKFSTAYKKGPRFCWTALYHDRFFYCAFVPNSTFLKENIDPAHFSLFFSKKMVEHFPSNSIKRKCFTSTVFPISGIHISQKKFQFI